MEYANLTAPHTHASEFAHNSPQLEPRLIGANYNSRLGSETRRRIETMRRLPSLPVSPHRRGPQTESECIHIALASSNAQIPNEKEEERDVPTQVHHLLVFCVLNLSLRAQCPTPAKCARMKRALLCGFLKCKPCAHTFTFSLSRVRALSKALSPKLLPSLARSSFPLTRAPPSPLSGISLRVNLLVICEHLPLMYAYCPGPFARETVSKRATVPFFCREHVPFVLGHKLQLDRQTVVLSKTSPDRAHKSSHSQPSS